MEPSSADHATPAETDAPPPAAVGPAIYGVIDVLRTDRIAGWAIDRRDSGAALDVDILREGAVVRTLRADRRRADLERGGVGTGNYGFRAEIDPPLEPGFEFTVAAVARASDGVSAALACAGPALHAPDPPTRLLQRIYEELTRRGDPGHGAVPAQRPEIDLADAVARIEVVQARIEASLAAIEPPKPVARDPALRTIVFGTLAVAVASLGVGLGSLWWP